MKIVNKLQKKIVRLLLSKNDWYSAKQLSADLSISIRTVKNHISEINKENENLILSSNKGYRINKDFDIEKVLEDKETLPSGIKERQNFIIRLLISDNKSINIYDLSEELCVSENTIKNDIKKIKQTLSKFNVALSYIDSENIEASGSEKDKRKIMSFIVYEEIHNRFNTVEELEKQFNDIDIKYLNKIIKKEFKRYNYSANDLSFANLVLHIAIAIERIKQNHTYQANEKNGNYEIKEITINIIKEIENKYDVTFNDQEIQQLNLLIAGSTIDFEQDKESSEKILSIVGEENLYIAKALFEEIDRYYYIKLKNNNSFTFFALHVMNLITRCKNKQFLRNPLTATVKTEFPLLFDCAINISHKFKELTSYALDDDEITFIAFHIGNILQGQKITDKKITYVLYSPIYFGYSSDINEKIQKDFSSKLSFLSVVNSEEEIKEVDPMMIIATTEINNITKATYVKISPFFNEEDKTKINSAIQLVEKNEKKIEFKNNLDFIFDEDSIFIENKITNYKKVINFMCKKLTEKGYVNEEFVDDVFKRESLSSTAYGNIAIPHSLKLDANKTSMSVYINPKGIDWNGEVVNLVFLLTSSPNYRSVFLKSYEALSNILNNPNNIKELINCHNYSEFVENIVRCY